MGYARRCRVVDNRRRRHDRRCRLVVEKVVVVEVRQVGILLGEKEHH